MNPKKIYRPDGSLRFEEWYDEEGRRHREDSSAYIWYYEDGVTIGAKFWYKHGKFHRLDGLAIIWYHEDGSIQLEYWYIDGEELTKDQVLTIKRNLTINKLLNK